LTSLLKNLILFLGFLFPYSVNGQVVYYQETCQCGVTGAGFSTVLGSGSGNFNIYIEPGSTVKKAILFGVRFWDESIPIVPTTVTINSNAYVFDSLNYTGVSFDAYGNFLAKKISIHEIDVTNDISASNLNYTINIPSQNECMGCSFGCFYLYVLYENPIFTQNTTSYILLSDKNEFNNVDFTFNNINARLNIDPMGFAIYSDRIGMGNDGSRLIFNNGSWINVGLLQGSDNVNILWDGGGVKGHFYFQDNVLYGLDDDTPDNLVGGSDGLLDASAYVSTGGELNWRLQWDQNTNDGRYNIYNGFFIEHSTPCDTFSVSVPSDTIICRGESLQLNVTGGSQYEWQPATDLSCSTCPNPLFTGDSTQLYTVRIWNNDSCSVVRPVKIKVQSCVGLEEQFTEESFTIHPNPTSGLIHLESKEWKNQELVIEVFDLLGKQKHAESILFQQDYWINLSLSPGTYLLKVTSPQNEFFTKRIVVE